jgi:uncharacterized protein (TIGR02145 family)
MKKAIIALFILLMGLYSSAQNESITNILVTPRTDGTGMVDVYFSLNGPDSSYNMRLEISFDSGVTYDSIQPYYVSGDVGGISPGDNKHIVWDGLGSFPDTYSPQSVLKIIAVAENQQSTIPTVYTLAVNDITETSAVSGGSIDDDGGEDVTARGVVWATFENPTLEANEGYTLDGAGTGAFVSYLNGLAPGTPYFVRAYAINLVGTAYGYQEEFTTLSPTCGNITVTDYDGNVYNTVLIGNQCWMAENLETTHYRNGEPIDYPGIDYWEWQENTTGAYAWYNDNISWKDSYGALYNWYAGTNSNGLCPAGWHVPTDAEWTTMSDYLGGNSIAGGKLKSLRTDPDAHPRWNYPNIGATNESNWSGYPGGTRDDNGMYLDFGEGGYWWTSTEYELGDGYSRTIFNDDQSLIWNINTHASSGLSIRCVMDQ